MIMNPWDTREKRKPKTKPRRSRAELPPGLASLKRWFIKSNLPLTEQQYKQLWQYHTLLRDRNAEYDLTRIHQFDSMVQKHYIDCILVAKLLHWHLPSPLLDIGTGAGLPAIPLKIVCPETECILSEGRHKRIQFLQEVIEVLNLTGIEVHGRRIYASFERPVKGVITRAVESIPETLARVKKSLVPGGKAIFMKGPHCDEEIREALHTFHHEYKLDRDISYTIPHTPHQRRLVIFERMEEKMEIEMAGTYQIHGIESSANKVFKHLKTLLTSKGIKRQGQALVFGPKVTGEVMRDYPEQVCGLILAPQEEEISKRSFTEPYPQPLREGTIRYRLSRPLYRELDLFGTEHDILLVRVPSPVEWQIERLPSACTLMIPFQDPENVGAVIRTAVAFGVGEIVLLREAAHPFHPKSIRAGGSAVFRVHYHQGPSIRDISAMAARIQETGLALVTLSMEGSDLGRFRFPARFILLPGVEGPGLPQNLRPYALAIPMEAGSESLNAATAVAITLYEWRRKRAS